MRVGLLLIFALTTTQSVASPKTDQAAVIERLSQIDNSTIFETTGVGAQLFPPLSRGMASLTVDGCMVTLSLKQIFDVSDVSIVVVVQMPLERTNIDLTANGKRYEFQSFNIPLPGYPNHVSTIGAISFSFPVPISSHVFFDQPVNINPLDLDMIDASGVDMTGIAVYKNERNPTEADISTLAQELLAYQRDYCLPAS